MAIQKKHIVVGLIGAVSLSAAALYWQYTKLMDYCLTFTKVKARAVTIDKVDADIYLNFKNNSNITINIKSQQYKVFMNDHALTEVVNNTGTVILPKATSEIMVNIKFSPKDLASVVKGNAIDLLLNRDKVKIKIDMKLKVSLWIFTFNIPFVYSTTLKDLLTPAPVTAPAPKAGKCNTKK